MIVLDISGSMGSQLNYNDNDNIGKLEAAKRCCIATVDQLNSTDRIGIVLFDHCAYVLETLKKVGNRRQQLKKKLSDVRLGGSTCLSKGMQEGRGLFTQSILEEKGTWTNRLLFMTDLNSTCDSVSDEKLLLEEVKNFSSAGIYTTVFGIGMDFNVALVEKVSCTVGCR